MPEDESCINVSLKDYVDQKIKGLEDRTQLELKALQSEYTKSEGNYPTRAQLDQAMKDYCPIKESDRLSRNIDILTSVIISIFLLFIAVYVLK